VIAMSSRRCSRCCHAHYLKDLQGFATLPDGTTKWLCASGNGTSTGRATTGSSPIFPRGTKVAMQFSYDNSSGNPPSPNQPPKPVKYGVQSADDGRTGLQMLARDIMISTPSPGTTGSRSRAGHRL
jgi:hypothetical protein